MTACMVLTFSLLQTMIYPVFSLPNLNCLGSGYGWACERTPAEREKEKEFYGIYFNEYHTIKNDQQSELEKLPDYLEENPSFDMKA